MVNFRYINAGYDTAQCDCSNQITLSESFIDPVINANIIKEKYQKTTWSPPILGE